MLLVSSLMIATPRTARAADSIELMAGNKSATADIRASADITKKFGLFLRARPSIDYGGKISDFGLADLTLSLTDGLDAVAEVQMINGQLIPRAGLQYFAKTRDFSLYSLATIGLDANPYLESLTVLKYAPAIYKTLKLLVQIENITDAGLSGHEFSTQRIRLGVSKNGWGTGVAVDLTEFGNNPKPADGTFGWNFGGFASKTF